MRKFILKKEYPGSPMMGSEITNFPHNGDRFYLIGDNDRNVVIECPWKYPEYYTEFQEVSNDSLFELVENGGCLINAKNLQERDIDTARSEGRLLYLNNDRVFAYIPPEQVLLDPLSKTKSIKGERNFWVELRRNYKRNEIPDLIILKDYNKFSKGERFVPYNWQFSLLEEFLVKGVVDLNEEFPKNETGNMIKDFGRIK